MEQIGKAFNVREAKINNEEANSKKSKLLKGASTCKYFFLYCLYLYSYKRQTQLTASFLAADNRQNKTASRSQGAPPVSFSTNPHHERYLVFQTNYSLSESQPRHPSLAPSYLFLLLPGRASSSSRRRSSSHLVIHRLPGLADRLSTKINRVAYAGIS